jgi:hypothetical protein
MPCTRGGTRDSLRRWLLLFAVLVLAMAMSTGGCANAPDDGDRAGSGDDASDSAAPGHPSGDGADARKPGDVVDSGEGGDAASRDGTPSDNAAVPVLTSIAPAQAAVGSAATTIVVTGTDFVARSVVQLDGAALATSFVSKTELRATIPAASMASVQTLHVTVGTAPPGGGASEDLPFEVVNPAPAITSLAPSSAPLGSPATVLTVTGASFVNGAKVVFDGVDLVTTFGSDTSVSATIPAAKLAASGSYNVTVVNPAPGGGASSAIAFTVTNPTVTVTSVTPQTVAINAAATAIQILGTGFVSASAVSFNGTTIASSTVDAKHMTATIPAALLTNASDFPVVVTNPQPGGGVSTPVMFHVVYPAPTATSLSPSGVVLGTAPPTLTVTGSGFVAGKTQIAFDGALVTSSVIDASHVSATLTTQQMLSARTIQVTVVNPSPGGGTSAPALSFVVSNPVPVASALSPSSALEGSGDTVVTVTGSSFVDGAGVAAKGSVVMIGQSALVTSFVSATQISATIPSAMLGAAKTLSLVVSNPAPGGGTSGALTFTVTNPGPTVTSVSPSSTTAPAQDTTITLTGTGFVNGNGVAANGSQARNGLAPLVTTFVSATTLTAVLPASHLASAATLSISVTNPQPGGGASGAIYFTVNNPAPTVSSVSPALLYFGAGDTTITLTGAGFVGGSVVKSNGATLASSTQSATQITATVPAAQLSTIGALSITVTNAAPGGGVSAAKTIQVACNTSGVDYALGALNQATSIPLSFTGVSVPTANRIIQTVTAGADLCPAVADATQAEPYRAYVVQNTLGQTASLSAWAACSSTANDAFLTFYKQATLPSDLEQCTGFVAEGKVGTGGHDSPESAGATFCPGLVGADALSLPACGRAVVLIQPFSITSTSYTPPPTLKIQLQ